MNVSAKIMGLLGGIGLMLSACGGGGFVGCDFRADEGDRCQDAKSDVIGSDATFNASYKMACEISMGVYLADGCPAEGRILGCEQDSGPTQTAIDWFLRG